MKKNSAFRLLILSLTILLTSAGCNTPTNILSSGSSLMTTLGANPNLSTVTGLLKTPGLSNALGSAVKGPFTLLAPTNDAFGSMTPAALDNLKNPANVQQVAGMLKNSIVPGKLDAASVENGGLKNAAGNPLNLNGANLGKEISAGNVNIIPIDKVIP